MQQPASIILLHRAAYVTTCFHHLTSQSSICNNMLHSSAENVVTLMII